MFRFSSSSASPSLKPKSFRIFLQSEVSSSGRERERERAERRPLADEQEPDGAQALHAPLDTGSFGFWSQWRPEQIPPDVDPEAPQRSPASHLGGFEDFNGNTAKIE